MFLEVFVPFILWKGQKLLALLRGNIFIDFLNLSTPKKNYEKKKKEEEAFLLSLYF